MNSNPNNTLFLPEKVIRKVDDNRAELSREEFVDLCVDYEIEHEHLEAPPVDTEYVTYGEYQRFRKKANDFINSLLNSLISKGLGHGKTHDEVIEKPIQTEDQQPNAETPHHKRMVYSESNKDIRREYVETKDEDFNRIYSEDVEEIRRLPLELWIPAILLFGFGDSLTSTLAFSAGAHEANPLLAFMVVKLGGSLMAFIIVKTLAITGLFFLSYYFMMKHSWLIPSLMCIAGTYLIFSNIIAYFRVI